MNSMSNKEAENDETLVMVNSFDSNLEEYKDSYEG